MSDEKLFVLGSRNWRYVKAEDDDEQPCLRFQTDKDHPPQLMVTAVVARPRPDKGFDGQKRSGARWTARATSTSCRRRPSPACRSGPRRSAARW